MAKFGSVICPRCKEQQWSIADCNYVLLFGHCWQEDKKECEVGTLSLRKFELREAFAAQKGIDYLNVKKKNIKKGK